MNVRIIVAAIAGGAALFLLGFLVYGLALQGWMMDQTVQYPGLMYEAPNFVTLILANLVWALLVALIFERWATISTFVGGLLGGATIAFFTGLYYDLMTYSFMNLHKSFVPIIVDVIAFTVIGGISGGVVGLVLGSMSKERNTLAA